MSRTGVDRVGRQPVDLGLVEQQEERSGAADAVVLVGEVQLGALLSGVAAARCSRRSARSRSSPSSPNWIESVGQACAQAGSESSLRRS